MSQAQQYNWTLGDGGGDGFTLPPEVLPSQITGLPTDNTIATYIQTAVPGYSPGNPLVIQAPSLWDRLQGLFTPSTPTPAPGTTAATPPAHTNWWNAVSGMGSLTDGELVTYAGIGIGALLLLRSLLGRRR